MRQRANYERTGRSVISFSDTEKIPRSTRAATHNQDFTVKTNNSDDVVEAEDGGNGYAPLCYRSLQRQPA